MHYPFPSNVTLLLCRGREDHKACCFLPSNQTESPIRGYIKYIDTRKKYYGVRIMDVKIRQTRLCRSSIAESCTSLRGCTEPPHSCFHPLRPQAGLATKKGKRTWTTMMGVVRMRRMTARRVGGITSVAWTSCHDETSVQELPQLLPVSFTLIEVQLIASAPSC